MNEKKYLGTDGLNRLAANILSKFSKNDHNHDDRYYTETEVNDLLGSKADASHTHTVDSKLDAASTNPVQNKVVNSALSEKVPISRTVNGKPLTFDISLTAIDVGADEAGAANSVLTSAKSYTDGKVADLLNNSTGAVDSIMELANAMQTNKNAIEALNSIASSKADATELTKHVDNSSIHITASERTNWNNAFAHTNIAHAPSNAEENQNAYSNITIGGTTISADTKTDTLTLEGSNITITPDSVSDKITFNVTKDNVTSALGYTPPTTDTTYNVGGTSTLGLTKLYTGTGTAIDGTMTQNAITDALNGKSDTSHTHDTSQVSGLDAALSGKAPTNHNHSASNITSGTLPIANGGTGQTTVEGIRGAIGINPVTTSGTGSAYTANVNGITSLQIGTTIIVIPHVVSTSTSPTLNVNGLGAKQIRVPLGTNSTLTSVASSDGFLVANKPVTLKYDGTFWVAIDLPRPASQNMHGILPVEHGGTGADTIEGVRNTVLNFPTNEELLAYLGL